MTGSSSPPSRCAPGERVDAETLAEALWGEQPPASATKVVQGCVSRLRKALGADAIETVGGGYRVSPGELDIDRQQFEDQVEPRPWLPGLPDLPERAIPLLADALALWRGPAFVSSRTGCPVVSRRSGWASSGWLRRRTCCRPASTAGDHAGVATDGTVLTGQQPFRERRWALLALAQYRSGRQADALASIRAARRALGQELGLDPRLRAGRARVQHPGPGPGPGDRPRGPAGAMPGVPVEGTRAVRRPRRRDLLRARRRHRRLPRPAWRSRPLLVVTGPSGSGKSSLVGAGLVPALRRRREGRGGVHPGSRRRARPWRRLDSRAAGDPLLVVDQFEETFTLRGSTFARPWLGDLARYAQESGAVVLVVRGDHVAAAGCGPGARPAGRARPAPGHAADRRVPCARSSRDRPRSPAYRCEPGLVDLVVRDADEQPGALPLLSHALDRDLAPSRSGPADGRRLPSRRRHQGRGRGLGRAPVRGATGPEERRESALADVALGLTVGDRGGRSVRRCPPRSSPALSAVRLRLLDLLVRGRLVTSADAAATTWRTRHWSAPGRGCATGSTKTASASRSGDTCR